MTLNEFKAWLDGFCDNMSGAPDDAQLEKIKKRLADVDDKQTERVTFVDNYYSKWPIGNNPYQPPSIGPANPWPNQILCGDVVTGPMSASSDQLQCGSTFESVTHPSYWSDKEDYFDSHKVFAALGREEYKELT